MESAYIIPTGTNVMNYPSRVASSVGYSRLTLKLKDLKFGREVDIDISMLGINFYKIKFLSHIVSSTWSYHIPDSILKLRC